MQTLMKIAKQTSVPVFQVSTKVPVSNVSLLSHLFNLNILHIHVNCELLSKSS